MPGIFKSAVLLVNDASESVRTTIPGGVAEIIGAVPGATLVWSVDLKAGRVTVSAEPPETAGKKSSKRD
ncbi:MAG TPA: hypothetical protein VML94_05830 [Thermoplasmata archaeon]|nr:hypothetical protein [Thermoplasmata archaeon]